MCSKVAMEVGKEGGREGGWSGGFWKTGCELREQHERKRVSVLCIQKQELGRALTFSRGRGRGRERKALRKIQVFVVLSNDLKAASYQRSASCSSCKRREAPPVRNLARVRKSWSDSRIAAKRGQALGRDRKRQRVHGYCHQSRQSKLKGERGGEEGEGKSASKGVQRPFCSLRSDEGELACSGETGRENVP